ncbi:MAG: prepilin-type N-terminal cleavage/methylation domain-containing protein [Desulfuromonadaceae bacterium]|nr:prepilin-type N-terminal cleavage/methylation domain-containing protein [Desulfuromonadaceae bacterium]
MNSRCQAEQGFTLLEVMIALAVIAIALVTLLGLANRSLAVNGRIQHMTHGTLLAQQKIAEIEAGVQHAADLAENADQGYFDEPFSSYRWEITTADTPLPAVRMVTVTVSWGEPERNETVAMTSFLFR